jgi:hypothetical protein
MPIVEEVPTVEEEAEVEVENVINVVKSGISLVHANLVVEVEEGTVHLVVAVVRRRLGKYFHVYRPFLANYHE